MHKVKLPEMEWKQYAAETKCTESGIYLWRLGECSGEEKFTKHDSYFAPGYEYAGPIEFDVPKPMPEPLQLQGCHAPEIEHLKCFGMVSCKSCSYEKVNIPLVCIHHPDRRTAILAHNAAVRVMMELSK